MQTVNASPVQTLNELVKVKDGHAVTTSREVARIFERRHDNVLRDIKALVQSLLASSALNFEGANPSLFLLQNFFRTSYRAKKGASREEYLLTKDAFLLLVMGYTGEKAVTFKLAYISRFNEMESRLRNEFLPAITDGTFKGLIPMQISGRRLLCYTDALRAIGYSTRSGSVQHRRKAYGNHFFKLYGRNFITIEFAQHLVQQRLMADRSQQLQMELPFNHENKGGSHA